jgi:hypothetical protein
MRSRMSLYLPVGNSRQHDLFDGVKARLSIPHQRWFFKVLHGQYRFHRSTDPYRLGMRMLLGRSMRTT